MASESECLVRSELTPVRKRLVCGWWVFGVILVCRSCALAVLVLLWQYCSHCRGWRLRGRQVAAACHTPDHGQHTACRWALSLRWSEGVNRSHNLQQCGT